MVCRQRAMGNKSSLQRQATGKSRGSRRRTGAKLGTTLREEGVEGRVGRRQTLQNVLEHWSMPQGSAGRGRATQVWS